MKKILLFLLVSACIKFPVAAQTDTVLNHSFFEKPLLKKTSAFLMDNRKSIVTAGIAANALVIFYKEYKWWWEGDYHAFRYQDEGFWKNYSYGMDKIGHAYICYFYYKSLYDIIYWSGFSKPQSMLIASAIPAIYGLSIEMGDGFSSYQFARDDMVANLLGIGYGALQEMVEPMQHIQFKWSYYPSAFVPWKSKEYSITDDYDGHIFWLAADVHELLPRKIKRFWPSYLNLALGYGVNNASATRQRQKLQREFIFGLDFNMQAIPLHGKFWHIFKDATNCYHLPAPSIKTSEGKKSFNAFMLN